MAQISEGRFDYPRWVCGLINVEYEGVGQVVIKYLDFLGQQLSHLDPEALDRNTKTF